MTLTEKTLCARGARTAIGAFLLGVTFTTAVGCAAGEGTDVDIGTPPDSGPDVTVETDAAPDVRPDAPHDVSQEPDAAQDDAATDALDADVTDAPQDVACPPGYKECDGQCVVVDAPEYGCASAGCEPCSFANASAICVNGSCSIESCETGFGDCNTNPADGCETNLENNKTHCAACGNACNFPNAAAACENFTCVIQTCNAGFDNCDPSLSNGCEANLQLDPSHCGFCNNLCQPAGFSACNNGQCQATGCPSGTGDCDGDPDTGCETNVHESVLHCGFCANGCVLQHATPVCTTGKCEVSTCDDAYGDCDGDDLSGCEIDLNGNAAHCGSCGAPCANTNNTSRTCDEGLCAYICSPGFADCNGPQAGNIDDGCETVTSNDVNNCGGCGVECTNDYGSTQCQLGLCVPACMPGYGNCDSNSNNGCETFIAGTDLQNCGACGTTCTNLNGTTQCTSGACVPACSQGFSDCDGNPNNGCETQYLGSDINNCGACGIVCSNLHGTTSCQGGQCLPVCSSGYADCSNPNDGCETNTNVEPSNCGDCGTVCQPVGGSACVDGSCKTTSCAPGTGDCDGNGDNGCETNITNNISHCGACSNVCQLAHATATCVSSKCQIGTCSQGYASCDGSHATGCEIDITASGGNCGSCDAPCSTLNNTSRACSSGACAYICSPGFADCNGPQAGNVDDGCETFISSDVNNCGGCDIGCTNAHGSTQCQFGVCKPTCTNGYDSCDLDPKNGCETLIAGSDSQNCGACGTTCTNLNGTTQCTSGTCVPSCAPGYMDCDSNPNNGCETQYLGNDINNCGGCGITCSNLQGGTTCQSGQCVPTCAPGYGDCSNPNDGCETNTNLDPSNCGTCGTVCQPVGGSACVDGACQTTACAPGTGDCDGNGANGCETNLTNNLSHCGACDFACALSNASASCVASKCQILTCNAGYASCDGSHSTGCEKDITSSVGHCGSCDAPCSTLNNTSRACSTGACSYVCSSGFADCDGPQPGNIDNGCETVTSADVNNCGGCGIQCDNPHGSTSCVTSKCTPACETGYGDCDSEPKNGCETDINTTLNHCGGCGIICTNPNGSTSCMGAACAPICLGGYADCDSNARNGCETSIASNLLNCGGCGVACQNDHGTTSCTSGSCLPECTVGYDDCDSNPINGCESNINNDPDHCGTCGNSCAAPHAQTSCATGACAIVSCEAQYYDLDKNPANGCEYHCDYAVPGTETCDGTDEDCDSVVDNGFDLLNDPNNCGTCGITCGSSSGGLCCNGTCKASDPNNCGACGQTCTSGMLVINELMIDPSAVGDDQGEWFELYNPNTYDVDMRGFIIKELPPGTETHTISSALPVVVPPGGYVVLAKNGNPSTNGGVQAAYQYATVLLGNGGDELVIVAHTVELDRVVWPSNFDVAGKSKELSINRRTAAANDTLTNWCTATVVYGAGDFGTPGTANTCSSP